MPPIHSSRIHFTNLWRIKINKKPWTSGKTSPNHTTTLWSDGGERQVKWELCNLSWPDEKPPAGKVSPPTVTQLTSLKQEKQETNCTSFTHTVYVCEHSGLWMSPCERLRGSSAAVFAGSNHAWWAPSLSPQWCKKIPLWTLERWSLTCCFSFSVSFFLLVLTHTHGCHLWRLKFRLKYVYHLLPFSDSGLSHGQTASTETEGNMEKNY